MADAFEDLARALEHETELVRALGDSLCRQRARIAAHDRDGIEAATRDVAAAFAAVTAAREARAQLLDAVAGDPELALEALPARLGLPAPPAYEAARRELRSAAERTRRETRVNRDVLQRLSQQSQAFLQALFSSLGTSTELYGPRTMPGPAPGMIVQRRA